MSKAYFKTIGNFGAIKPATVIVDRASDLVSVRIFKRRKLYTVPLSYIAEHIVWNSVKQELAEKKRLKKKK